jgi:superfamily II DNA or RNA helicase
MPSLSTVEKLVPARIRTRGDRYFDEDRVEHLRREADGCVAASVRGSDPYEVRLLINPDGELGFDCECAYFAQNLDVCKHVWATLRAADRALFVRLDEIVYLNAMFDEEELPSRESNLVPFPRRATTRPDWHNRLERLPAALPAAAPEGEILYALDAASPSGIQIRSLIRKPRKTGGFLKPKTFAPSHAEIARLDPADREILGLMYIHHYAPEWDEAAGSVLLRGSGKRYVLSKAAATGRLFLQKEGQLIGPLSWDEGEPWTLRLRIESDSARGVYRLDGEIVRGGDSVAIAEAEAALPGFLLHGTQLSAVEPEEATQWIDSLARAPIEAHEAEREEFIAALLGRAPVELELPGELQRKTERPVPVARLLLVRGSDREGEGWTGRFLVRYGDLDVSPGEGPRSVIAGDRVILRDLAREADFLARLESLRVVRDYFGEWRIRASQEADVLPALAAEGWEIELHGQPLRLADDVTLEIETGIDWFDLKAEVRFGTLSVPVAELMETPAGVMRKLSDGSFGLVRTDLLEGLEFLEGIDAKRDGRFRFSNKQALLIDLLTRSRRGARADAGFEALRGRVLASAVVEPRMEGPEFVGELRPYQRDGLGWLHHLRTLGIGGCLADDMGLGKTVQMLALLSEIYGSRKPGGQGPGNAVRPSLVVAPRSLLFNWKEEAARFAPHLRVVEHHGTERRKAADFEGADLVLTTYGTLRADAAHLSAIEFEYVVLDEAQAIKNATSQTAKTARLLKARHRLALSGTPIENHIGELWSLFEFLNPGMLGAARWFRRHFGGRTVPPQRRNMLAAALRPLILRRTKEQVAPELPPRVEQTLWCDLEPPQRALYDRLRLSYRASLLEKVKSEGMQSARMHVLEALLRLRQAACDPSLIDPSSQDEGTKLEVLMDELEDVVESGHRALVFSQFTSFLSLAAKKLEKQKVRYAWLDGKTVDRQRVVRSFQEPDGPPVFLISLKAGGLGLNLTNADYVFLLDPWWNPAVEAQAIDRTHRIGQEKPVFAYRIIARDTVEEKILELQASKRELADSILTEDNSVLRSLDVETLEKLLS